MSETFPAGVLRNTATGRFHPIVFYPSPRPSEAGDLTVRHRSKGHHTAGFDTMDEAVAFIDARPTWRHTRLVWAWDGEGVPALTFSFPLPDDCWGDVLGAVPGDRADDGEILEEDRP